MFIQILRQAFYQSLRQALFNTLLVGIYFTQCAGDDSNIKGPSDYEYSSEEDGIDLTGEAEEEDTGDLRKEADKMFDKWMNHVTNFNYYLYQGAKEIENMKCCGPKELV